MCEPLDSPDGRLRGDTQSGKLSRAYAIVSVIAQSHAGAHVRGGDPASGLRRRGNDFRRDCDSFPLAVVEQTGQLC